MTNSCLFCKIINKQIPASIIYENNDVIVFKDINPKDTTHLLIVPKIHTNDLNSLDLRTIDSTEIFKTIQKLGTLLEKNHYRIQLNNGKEAGQEIFHLHFHFLSSSKLKSTGLS